MSATRKRRGLGQGLGALIPGVPESGNAAHEPEPVESSGLREIPIDSILPNPFQPRSKMEESRLEELANSIREHGIIQPLIVTQMEDGAVGERFRLIAGERRWRAARRVGLTHVPVVVKEATEREMLELALIENIQRADLNAIEEALAYQQMAEFSDLTHDEIAKRVGKSRPAVTNTMRLLDLPEPIQDMIRQEDLREGHARMLLSLPSASAMMEAAELFAKEGFTVREAEAWVNRVKKSSDPSTPTPLSVHDHELQRQFTSVLGTRVELRRRKKGGQIVIHFENEEDLQSIYNTLLSE